MTDHDQLVLPVKSMRMQSLILRAGQYFALATLGLWAGSVPAQADSTKAICILSRHDHTIAVERGTCSFGQRQGNVTILFNHWAFSFPSAEQNKTYQRTNTNEGIRFTRQGAYTLQVLWSSTPSKRSPR